MHVDKAPQSLRRLPVSVSFRSEMEPKKYFCGMVVLDQVKDEDD
jgi:hypothetical protein